MSKMHVKRFERDILLVGELQFTSSLLAMNRTLWAGYSDKWHTIIAYP